jgi:hypothetical protein
MENTSIIFFANKLGGETLTVNNSEDVIAIDTKIGFLTFTIDQIIDLFNKHGERKNIFEVEKDY